MYCCFFDRLEAFWVVRIMGNCPSSIRMGRLNNKRSGMKVMFFYRLEAIWVIRIMGNCPSSIRMRQPQRQKFRNERVVFFYQLEAI
jgi:hypothetical protein